MAHGQNEYAFDWKYIKRFWTLQKIFFPKFATDSSGNCGYTLLINWSS